MATGEWGGPLWGATLKEDLESLCAELKLDKKDFSLLLIGDGSGTIFTKPCGWACVAWNTITDEVVIHNGSVSSGTNNFAELVPYAHALWYFHQELVSMKSITKPKVEVVSDSEVTVRCGNGVYQRKSNAAIWASVQWYVDNAGFDIHWNHVYRNTNRFSKRCDWLAGQSRTGLESLRKHLLTK
jgi:ribonuclease HI